MRRSWREVPWRQAAAGFLTGTLLGLGLWQLGLYPPGRGEDVFLGPAFLGAAIGVTKARRGFQAITGIVVLALLIIGYSPLVPWLMRGLTRADVLEPSPAIVVLSAAVHQDQSLNAEAQSRVLQGYFLLRQKRAPRLVLTAATAPFGSEIPSVRRQMTLLKLAYPLDEVGPVQNTHDEAIAVSRLARQKGWKRVILVTHPWHMRRAAAAFAKAGLPVLCSPCAEESYDLGRANAPAGRLAAFRDWLHETLGYQVYQWRGWI